MIKHFMEKHEVKCFFNPNRICPNEECVEGIIPESYMEYLEQKCPDCERFEKIQEELKPEDEKELLLELENLFN